MIKKMTMVFNPNSKNIDANKKARELSDRYNCSLVASMSMINDAQKEKQKVFEINSHISSKTNRHTFLFVED